MGTPIPKNMKVRSLDGLRLLGAAMNDVFIGPKSVIIDITNRCNLNCLFCWYHSILKKDRFSKTVDFPIDTFKELIDDCADVGIEEIVFGGLGDPLAHPGIKHMIGIANEKGVRMQFYTNFACEKDILKSLVKADHIVMNLAAATHKRYEKLQDIGSGGNFKRVIRNLSLMQRMRNRGLKTPKITLSFIINEINHDQVEDIFRLARKFDLDKIKYKILDFEDHSRHLTLSPGSMEKLKVVFRGMMKSDGIHSIDNNLKDTYNIFLNENFLSGEQHKKSYIGGLSRSSSCFTGWYQTYVTLNGDIKPCCRREDIVIGNIFRNSFREIWNSESYGNVRRTFKDNFDISMDPWRNCRFCDFMLQNDIVGKRLKRLDKK